MAARSNPPTYALVPRYVEHGDPAVWHICLARYNFAHGDIVSLESLCGLWCYGTLSRMSHDVLVYTQPEAQFCAGCEAHYINRRQEIDPYHAFRWRAPNTR